MNVKIAIGASSVLCLSAPVLTAQESNQVKQLEQPVQPLEESGWRPTDPIRIGRGPAYVNIGLVGTFAAGGSTASDIEGGLEPGGHDPNQRGFTVQGVELNLSGAVDPYFRGNVNVLFSLDAGGESFLEL